MSAHNTLAGLLMAIGVIGLALAPSEQPSVLGSPPTDVGNATEVEQATIAISLGAQLRLEPEDAAQTASETSTAARRMVCGTVYQIADAHIGFSCREAADTRAIALVN